MREASTEDTNVTPLRDSGNTDMSVFCSKVSQNDVIGKPCTQCLAQSI
jgi:hypothetical protein